MDSVELHFKLKFPSHRFWQCRGLALWTHKAITSRFLEFYVEMNLKHCGIFHKKREIKPEENLLLLKLTWSSFMSVPYWLVAWQM